MSTDPVTSAHFFICIHQHTHTKLSHRSFASVDPLLLHGDLLQHTCKGTFLFIEQSKSYQLFIYSSFVFLFFLLKLSVFSPGLSLNYDHVSLFTLPKESHSFPFIILFLCQQSGKSRAKQSQTFNEIYILKYMLTQS